MPRSRSIGNSAGDLHLFNDAGSGTSSMTDGSKHSASLPVGDTLALSSPAPRLPDLSSPDSESPGLVTTRLRRVMVGDGHAIPMDGGDKFRRGTDKPIHMPGAVQAFGLLIVVKEGSEGRFIVHSASENSARFLGYTPLQLFCLDSFLDIFSDEEADSFLDHIDLARDKGADPTTNDPDIFTMLIRLAKAKRGIKLWCAMHISPTHPELIICEFELDDDCEYPLQPPEFPASLVPEDTLYQGPTAEESNDSTDVDNKHLKILRSTRRRRSEAGAIQIFDVMSQVQEKLAAAPNLEKFLKVLVSIVKELTGFHRVMVHQFDRVFNGKVVAELVDPNQTQDLYMGLQFPASDFSKQARELHRVNKVRLLYDRDLEPAQLVYCTTADKEQPLELANSYLSAMSPSHITYTTDVAARASMSISVNSFDELWGVISCHTYGARGMRVPFPVRKVCGMISNAASRNVERLSYASRLQAGKLINTVPTEKNPSGYIVASSEDLLVLFDADFGMLSIDSETKMLGKIEHSREVLALLEYFRLQNHTTVMAIQDIKRELPELDYPPGFSNIAGILYVPLSIRGADFFLLFRKAEIRDVKWARNPHEKPIKEETASHVEPRKNFHVWHEVVVGKCREWSDEQMESAATLCLLYGKFIQVWRHKDTGSQHSRLTRLLLANTAHEVRTPLNAIINFLEIAMEGALDQQTRDILSESHRASKSLIYVVNDLLDLTRSGEGQRLNKDEIFDLSACLEEATALFKSDATRKGLACEIVAHPGLPSFVHGNHYWVCQVLTKVAQIALRHTTQGSANIEYYVAEVVQSRVEIDVLIHITCHDMEQEQVDALLGLEQVSILAEEADSIEADPIGANSAEISDDTGDGRALGLGTAVVAQILRNMDGQLLVKSEEKGSRLVIQLPFELPNDSTTRDAQGAETLQQLNTSPSWLSVSSVNKPLPLAQNGEAMLVDQGNTSMPYGLSERIDMSGPDRADSMKSSNSTRSVKSRGDRLNNQSDAEHLIDAIQRPLNIGGCDFDTNHRVRPMPSMDSLQEVGSTNSHPERPPPLMRSSTSPTKLVSQATSDEGMVFLTDSRTPIRPIRVPEDYTEPPSASQESGHASKVLFEMPD